MVSSAVDLMRQGLVAYLDVVFPGEGIRVFDAEPALSGRFPGNLRARRRGRKARTAGHLGSPGHQAPGELRNEEPLSFRNDDLRISMPALAKLRPLEGDELVISPGKELDAWQDACSSLERDNASLTPTTTASEASFGFGNQLTPTTSSCSLSSD